MNMFVWIRGRSVQTGSEPEFWIIKYYISAPSLLKALGTELGRINSVKELVSMQRISLYVTSVRAL